MILEYLIISNGHCTCNFNWFSSTIWSKPDGLHVLMNTGATQDVIIINTSVAK